MVEHRNFVHLWMFVGIATLHPYFVISINALPSPGVNPLEGSPMWSCGIGIRKGAPDFQHYKGVEGRARSLILHPKQTTKWLVYIREHPWVLGQATSTLDHKTHHGPDSKEATTFPHIVFSAPHFGDYIQMALFPGTPKLESRNCPGWSPGTLRAHNSRLQSLIATKSKPNL
jgi:hypothetical protein